MDYKNKYNASLELADDYRNAYLEQGRTEEVEVLEEIFPELKENKDEERIRRHLIKHFGNKTKKDWNGVPVHSILTWLEKKGDKDKLIKELGEYKVKYTQEVLEKHLNSMNNKDDERLRKTTIAFLKDFAEQGYENAVECIDWLEKQGKKPQGKSALEAINEVKVDNQNCVKSTDKVEPKFNVGDWVFSSVLGTAHIIGVNDSNEYYQLEYIDGKQEFINIDYVNYAYDKWAISDAKDGDALAFETDEVEWVLIYKEIVTASSEVPHDLLRYYSLLSDNYSNWRQGVCGMVTEDYEEYLKPATKEQRDKLEKAMADAGYEWDTEKKELKKIESKFKVGNWYQCTKDFFGKGVTFDKNTAYYCAQEGCLQCEYGCHIAIVKDLYDNFKLWDISDAKDGDVLVTVDDEDDERRPFIYKGCLDPNHPDSPVAYCGIDTEGYFCRGGGKFNHWWTDEKVQPATKEQRDLLFSKMKEAGYEWDAEKKELKKITDNTYCAENSKGYQETGKCFADGECDAKRKYGNMFGSCEIEHIEPGKYYYCIKDYYADGNKRASKGDVVLAKRGMSMMALGANANEYFLPVYQMPNQEWGEEDDDALGQAIIAVKDAMYTVPNDCYTSYKLPFSEVIERLKSIRGNNKGIVERLESTDETL